MSDTCPYPGYVLRISYRSNERPWETTYEPYPKDRFGNDDTAAQEWASGMAEQLWDYDVTLFKDGDAIPFDRD